jgi:NAD(P)-dependent dehydrogenase (short-subunit alcohol dehydrogenase family)
MRLAVSHARIRKPAKCSSKRSSQAHTAHGSIVNVASMYGLVAAPLNVSATAYATSKHAVIGLTRSDALAFAYKGRLRVAAAGTGDHEQRRYDRDRKDESAYSPLCRGGGDWRCVAFMHSDAASYMIGATLVADGGYTIV